MVLLFLLTAVIPAAGFFTVAYRMQVRTDVKYTQLQLARDIPRRAERLKQIYEERPGAVSPIAKDPTVPVYDLYYAFPYATTLERATEAQSQEPSQLFLDPGGVIQSVLEYSPCTIPSARCRCGSCCCTNAPPTTHGGGSTTFSPRWCSRALLASRPCW